MDRLRGLLLRLRALFRREGVERELRDEIEFHLAMEAEAGERRGLTPEQARRDAVLRFGGVDRFTEEARDARGLRVWDELIRDVRLSLRLLHKHAAFTAAVVLTLALGIGANTAIFSVVDAVLLGHSAFRDPQRLVMLWETDRDSHTRHEPASWPDVEDFRRRSRTLSQVAAMMGWESTEAQPGSEPERVSALLVTPNLLGMLGVRPVLGRLFTADEGATGTQGPLIAVLSAAYWRRRFGADAGVIGRTVRINDRPTTIVGVVPTDADLGVRQVHERADYSAPFSGTDVDLWIALTPTAREFPRETHPFLTIARLAPGATLAEAQQELGSISASLERTYPVNKGRGVNLEAYTNVVFGGVRMALLLLLGAAMLVLLVTCANVGNLLLVRTTSRAREVALRRALGAAGPRIARQFLVESLLLTVLGALGGVVLAFAALRAFIVLAPVDVPRLRAATVDGRVLLFTAGVAGLAALLFGLLPALHSARVDVPDTLRAQAGRGSSEAGSARRLRSALVVAEVALAVSLTVGAGLLLRSFWLLRDVDPGFQPEHVLKVQYQLPLARYPVDRSKWPHAPAVDAFHDRLLRRVRALPGVEAAALANPYPLDPGFTNSFVIVGREAESRNFPEIRTRFATPGYLRTLHVPLLRGRFLRESDDADAPAVVVINRTAETRYFRGRDPLGQVLGFWGMKWRIVGVIGDERFQGLAHPPEPAVYAAFAQAPESSATLLVRTAGSPMTLVPAIRRGFHRLDPELALYGAETLNAALSTSIAKPRFTATLLGLFAGLALLLALIGVHGVLAYAVARRAPEMGIRMALGASRQSVLRLVVGEGVRLAGAGIALGLVAALAASRLLGSMVFGVTTTDPATFAGVAIAVVATAALASYLPARRAAGADPMRSLRAE